MILAGIEQRHIEQALDEIDQHGVPAGRQSTTFELERSGRRYPPKYVISLASRYATGRELPPNEFEFDQNARGLLSRLGFTVMPKDRATGGGGERDRSLGALTIGADLAEEIRVHCARLVGAGALRPRHELERSYATFRSRFGPDCLKGLDGAALLDAIHAHGNSSSLVYWLEFKDDEEMPAIFGSIAGGSALKFGLYKRKETGVWMTGSPTAQRELTLDEAIALARKHRDQLVAGAAVLEAAARQPEAVDYSQLQDDLERVAPDVAESAWGHKYFSLLFPTVLDDYHAPDYQRFYLIKLQLQPPTRVGRYIAAEGFVSTARQLGLPMQHLPATLNDLHGRPHRYWRIGTGTEQSRRSQWPAMRTGSYVAVGWNELGDLADIAPKQEGKDALRTRVEARTTLKSQVAGRAAAQLFKFVAAVAPGDIVLAADGATVLGIGRVTGDYRFDDDGGFAHRRAVEWLSLDEWRLPSDEGLRTTIHEIRKDAVNLVEVERRIRAATTTAAARPPTVPPVAATPRALEGTAARIQTVLERKGQVILFGPPGTGKTHHGETTALELAARSWFAKGFEDLSDAERAGLLGTSEDGAGAVEMCSFHPAYGYEDFLEGYRPLSRDGVLVFERRDGLFKRLCQRALVQPRRSFFLIIDEINRGDVPRIFGELLTVLEKNRRGRPVTLPLSGEAFTVPPNVYLIGTMNTADRSVALLDAALRRRFGFVELLPDASVLGNAAVAGVPLGPWLDALNARVLKHVSRDARNLQVGHAYLMAGGHPVSDVLRFTQILRDDIIPLLEEYCYEDYDALEQILGPSLVLRERRRVNDALFLSAREADLIRALLEPCPDIIASPQAVASDAAAAVGADDEDDAPDGTEG